MQLKIKRSQRKTFTGKIIYHLDIRADIPNSDLNLIKKYKLGKDQIYTSASLQALASSADAAIAAGDMLGKINPIDPSAWGERLKGAGLGIASRFAEKITVNDLTKGKSIECKDLNEMLEAEQAVVTACENLKAFLEAAETFDGREIVIDI